MKTLMVVSGGDAPGINTAIARYTEFAHETGDIVVGSVGGFPGLLDEHIVPLSPMLLMPWIDRAGSYLQSSREPVLSKPDAQARIKAVLQQHQIDNVILFGGDGTLRHIPPLLEAWDIASIGIPTTIDNDVPGTDLTLGFDSACNFAYQTTDGILATAHAISGRIFMIETLGGYSGMLALAVAQGAGAHAVLVPEYTYDQEWLSQRLLNAIKSSGYALLVLSEGVKEARSLAEDIPHWTNIRMRDARLGHAQRGAKPSHGDRVLATQMMRIAFDSLRAHISSGIVIVHEGQLSLHEGVFRNMSPRLPDRKLYNLINGIADEHTGD